MTTTVEAAVAALHAQLEAALAVSLAGARVTLEDAGQQDEAVPDAGQLGVFLDDRGAPAELNDGAPYYRSADVRLECLVVGATAAIRAARMRAMLDAIEAAIDADRSLGGVVTDCDREAADPSTVPVEGAPDAATEIVLVVLEFLSTSRL